MSKRVKLLRLIQYNLKFIYPKILFILFLLVTMSLTVMLTIRNKDFTSIDAIVYFFGGYHSNSLSIFQIIIALFPYIMLGIIVERYISEIYDKKSMYLLIRIKDRKIYMLSHTISILLIMAIVLVFLNFNVIVFSKMFLKNSMNHAIQAIEYSPSIYPFWKFSLNIFIGQLTGVFLFSLIQLLIKVIFNRSSIGFMVIMIVYLLNIANLTSIGSHIIITKLNVLSNEWKGIDIGIYSIINLTIALLLIIILLNINKFPKGGRKHG